MENIQPFKKEAKDRRFEEPTFIDPLTGLFNQYYLYQFLPEELKKAKLSKYPLALFMLDLDGFKGVNDKYGHLTGDEALKQLSAIIKKALRQTDMVIRYAGDEFLLLLPTADAKIAEMLSRKLLEYIDKNVFKTKDGQDMHLTISIGFAVYPNDSEEMDELIGLADKALYLSKQRGKNRVSHAKEVTLEAVSSRAAMDFFPCRKFINRETIINALKNAFDTDVVKSNLLQVSLIMGEGGTGKSRILSEFSNYAHTQYQAAAISACSSLDHIQGSYHLFSEAISTYIEEKGLNNPQTYNLISKIPPLELMQLARIIPSIASMLKVPAVMEPEDKKSRFLLFKGFLDFFIELSKTHPVLILLDDVQWVDKASVELIRCLAKQERNKRIFIACAFTRDKSSQAIDNSSLKELLEDLHSEDNFTQHELENFSPEDSSKLINTIFLHLEAEKEFYELLYKLTVGNPADIEEVLKLLVENAVIFYQDNHWQVKRDFSNKDIPVSMGDVVKNRVKKLDEETKEMILQAAVIGDNFSTELLKKIGNKNEGIVMELLTRAKKIRMLDQSDTRGQFNFVNKDMQQMLYTDGLDKKQRGELHYKIGQALIDEHKDNLSNIADEAVFHFSKAPKDSKTDGYINMLSEGINQLFNPSELAGYLDRLTREIMEEKNKYGTNLSVLF